MSQGIPAAFRVGGSLPSGVPAYRQDTIHNSTTQNEFRPDQTVKIPLSTGTTGSFWAVSSTARVTVDVEIENSNPMADFDNFTRCGMAKLFREVSFDVNGTPVEQNRNYAATVELELIRYGRNTDPFYMTFPNDYEVGGGLAGPLHINLVKPSLINAFGSPWSLHHTDAKVSDPYAIEYGSDLASSIVTSSIEHAADGAHYNVHARNLPLQSSNLKFLTVTETDTNNPPVPGVAAKDANSHYLAYTTGKKYGDGPLVSARGGAPLLWPYCQPFDAEKLQARVEANRRSRTPLADVGRYFANVKYLPIMPQVEKNGMKDYLGFGTNSTTYGMGVNRKLKIHACMELYLGTIGVLAERAFPALAVGAGRAELSIRLETERRFFQLTMDPCRRVPGTVRDWCPYFGLDQSAKIVTMDTTIGNLGKNCGLELLLTLQQADPVKAGDTELEAVEKLVCLKDAVCMGLHPLLPHGRPSSVLLYTASEANSSGVSVSSTNSGEYATTSTDLHTSAKRQDLLDHTFTDGQIAWRPGLFAPPVPQYIPVSSPYTMREGTITAAVCSEKDVCFGTYMKRAYPQSRRTTAATRQNVDSGYYTNEIPRFVASGFAFHVDEILFNDAITSQILAAGIAGNAVIETNILVEAVVQLPKNESQNVLIPITGASIDSICLAFQHPDEIQGPNAIMYSACNFINPFASLTTVTRNVLGGSTYTGWEANSPLVNGADIGINLQFQLGSEIYPRRPLNDLHLFTEFVSKGDSVIRGAGEQGSYNHMGGHACQLDFFSAFNGKLDSSYRPIAQCMESGFFAAHCPVEALADQTITENHYFLTSSAAADSKLQSSFTSDGAQLGAVPCRTLFEPYVGTFHIPINMETFVGSSKKMKSGASIVNNSFFVKFDKATQCKEAALQMLVVARCHATMVFERGGGVQLIR